MSECKEAWSSSYRVYKGFAIAQHVCTEACSSSHRVCKGFAVAVIQNGPGVMPHFSRIGPGAGSEVVREPNRQTARYLNSILVKGRQHTPASFTIPSKARLANRKRQLVCRSPPRQPEEQDLVVGVSNSEVVACPVVSRELHRPNIRCAAPTILRLETPKQRVPKRLEQPHEKKGGRRLAPGSI